MKTKTVKVGDYVKGIYSDFIHGKIKRIDGCFARLEDGSSCPLITLRKSTKKEVKALPSFVQWTKSSNLGLGIF